jgi:phenylacetate-CoA ligase
MEMPIISSVEGIRWPALPAVAAASRLAVLFQLEQSQWWPLEKIRQRQFTQINTLLRHCVAHVPYYRETLGHLVSIDGIDQQQWLRLPVLTRDQVQQAGERLHTTVLSPSHGKVSMQRTSGSTGKPVETLSTEITAFFWNIFTLRDHLWHRRDFSRKLAAIRFSLKDAVKPPHGAHAKTWGRATYGLFETGPAATLSILAPISEQVAWLQREDPDYLVTHPSVLTELALYCQREAIELPSLREVRTISELLPDGLRELCQQVWGVKLVDMYSTVELGYLALQCPAHEHYHVQSEGVLLEILDDNDEPCAAGETGRVVVTDLHNFAFPLIRYEVGDYAEVGEPCDCGRGLPVLKHIKGRYRNILTMPDGERRYPQLAIQHLHEIAPVQQFQAVQHTLNDIEIRLVLPRPLTAAEREKIISKFQHMLGTCFNFDVQQVDSLPRSASGKFEDFVSMLQA